MAKNEVMSALREYKHSFWGTVIKLVAIVFIIVTAIWFFGALKDANAAFKTIAGNGGEYGITKYAVYEQYGVHETLKLLLLSFGLLAAGQVVDNLRHNAMMQKRTGDYIFEMSDDSRFKFVDKDCPGLTSDDKENDQFANQTPIEPDLKDDGPVDSSEKEEKE